MSLLQTLQRVLLAAVLFFGNNCGAEQIDPTFGAFKGYFDRLFWEGKELYAQSSALDGAGNIYVVGNVIDGTGDPFVYSQTSSGLDRGYGKTPVALNTTFDGYTNFATSSLVDGMGRVVVGGYITLPLSTCADGSLSTSYAFVARFTSDGSVDTSFGKGGPLSGTSLVRLPCSSPQRTIISLQSNGKILLASTAWPNDRKSAFVLLSRISPDGVIDSGFGNGGIVKLTTPSADEDLILADTHVAYDDKIVIAGIRRSKISYETTGDVFKLLADGENDDTFGTAGIYHFAPTEPVALTALAINSSGQIYLAATDANDAGMSIARLTVRGTMDESFGVRGIAMFRPGSYSSTPQKLSLDLQERLNVVGYAQDWAYDGGKIFVLHLNAHGTVNRAIGSEGIFEQPCGFSGCVPFGVLIDPQGRTVISVYTDEQTILFRYDEVFGTGFD